MGWQLVYTSSARCLKAGQSGFGTVARHREIRDRLVEILERASSYERGLIQAVPRIDSHRMIEIGGEHYHVLTRIRDAGSDYSGRTNHMAHHVVFGAEEVRATDVSPADFLAGWRGWLTGWSEPPRYLGPDEMVELGGVRPAFGLPATHWAEAAGDAGLAACLSPYSEVCLVVEPGREDDWMPLVGESLALLGERAWSVTFTTALKSNDRPGDYIWRGCWRGSSVESLARARAIPVLDLSDPTSFPEPDLALVDFARTGIRPEPMAGRPVPEPIVSRAPAVLPEGEARWVRHRAAGPAILSEGSGGETSAIGHADRGSRRFSWSMAVVLTTLAVVAAVAFGVFGLRKLRSPGSSGDGMAPGRAPGAPAVSAPVIRPPAEAPPSRATDAPGPRLPQGEPGAPVTVAPAPDRPEMPPRPREPDVPPTPAFCDADWGRCPTLIANGPFVSLEAAARDCPALRPTLERIAAALVSTDPAFRVLVATNSETRERPFVLRPQISEERIRCYANDVPFLTIECRRLPAEVLTVSVAEGRPAIWELRIGWRDGTAEQPLVIIAAAGDEPMLGRRARWGALHPVDGTIRISDADLVARLGRTFGSTPLVLRSGGSVARLAPRGIAGGLIFDARDRGSVSSVRPMAVAGAPAGGDAVARSVLELVNRMRAEGGLELVAWDQIATEERFLNVMGATVRSFVGSVNRHAGRFFEASRDLDQQIRFGARGDGWSQMKSLDVEKLLKRTARSPLELERSTLEKWGERLRNFSSAFRQVQNRMVGFREYLERGADSRTAATGEIDLADPAGVRIECEGFGPVRGGSGVVLVEFE